MFRFFFHRCILFTFCNKISLKTIRRNCRKNTTWIWLWYNNCSYPYTVTSTYKILCVKKKGLFLHALRSEFEI